MNFDPVSLFVGLMAVFSVLLSCAQLTSLLMGQVEPVALGNWYGQFTGAQTWVAFLFASYRFGNLVVMLGSWSHEFYDRARPYTLNAPIAPQRCCVAALGPPGAGREAESVVTASMRRIS